MFRAIGFLLVVVILFLALGQWFSVSPAPSKYLDSLPDAIAKAIDVDLAISQQIATLTIALIGGLAGLVLSSDVRVRITTWPQQALFIAAGLASFCSLFAAHYVSSRMAEMLAEQFYNRADRMIAYPRSAQYYCFLLGVACFTALLLSAMRPRRKRSQTRKGNRRAEHKATSASRRRAAPSSADSGS